MGSPESAYALLGRVDADGQAAFTAAATTSVARRGEPSAAFQVRVCRRPSTVTVAPLRSDFAAASPTPSQATTSWNCASRVSLVATRIRQTDLPDGVLRR